MKNILIVALVALAMSALCVHALDNVPIPAGGFYDGSADAAARVVLSNNLTSAISAAVVMRADTNVTTDVTIYTPRRVGDVLLGGSGSGTNAVWVSKGATTNDWVQLKP